MGRPRAFSWKALADEKLTSLALRLVLSDHTGISHESQPDLLTEAEQVFAPKKPKAVKAKDQRSEQAAVK
jgi:ParB family transcriptional regulator, chromosome partitioning protein